MELVGLLKSTIRWLAELSAAGAYGYSSVQLHSGRRLIFSDWNAKLQASFEQHFWVPTSASDDGDYAIEPHLVNRRGIYKVCASRRSTISIQTLSGHFRINCQISRLPVAA